jgi:hypothetical protein
MSAGFAICAPCLILLSCTYIAIIESVLEQFDCTSYRLQQTSDIDSFVVDEGTFCVDCHFIIVVYILFGLSCDGIGPMMGNSFSFFTK